MHFTPPCPEDLATIAQQLGKRPHNVVAVAQRCPAGHPSVIVTYPLRWRHGRIEPFPSQLWLTCPNLSKQLANLERQGLIDQLERQLQKSPRLQKRLIQDHRCCVAHRWRLLDQADRTAVRRCDLMHVFANRGIGGVSDWMSIKCLHVHYAHHLSIGSAIGQILAQHDRIEPCAGPAIRQPHETTHATDSRKSTTTCKAGGLDGEASVRMLRARRYSRVDHQ